MSKSKAHVLDGKTATIGGELGGFFIRVDGVPAKDSGNVLADIISAFQQLKAEFPDELIPDLQPVGGGFPVPVVDDWFEEGKKKWRKAAIGFDARAASPTRGATANV